MIKNYKILIVDNDPTLRLIAEKKLSQHGYQVISAESGEKGILYALEQSPDLLLLDYELPDMSGVDVCRHLRNHTSFVAKPILFITDKEDHQTIETAFLAGATDFSRKPLNWSILIYRIQYMLRSHEINLSLLFSEERLINAQKIAKIANWNYNPFDKSFTWSDTIYDILENNSQQVNIIDLQGFIDKIPDKESEFVQLAIDNCLENHIGFELEHSLKTARGNNKTISHLGSVIKNDLNEVIDCIGTLQDITERRNAENEIKALAYYDSLTGLMNRESFLSVLDDILRCNKNYDLMSALLFIDLDDFKRVNDNLGHNFGDLLLCEIAERLKHCVRTAELEHDKKQKNKDAIRNHRMLNGQLPDSVFRLSSLDVNRFDLGRLGGDEFTVFLTDIMNEEVAASVASRLLKALEKPFHLDGHEVFVTFSIGISIAPNDGEAIQTLLKNADLAMYSAKADGKNNFKFYTQSMNERSLYRLTLETDLRNAITNNELRLVYQPLYCLQTNRLVGAEALMRWKHKTKGEIPPVDFISLAEETGQILGIGDWLFQQFSKDLEAWNRLGLLTEGIKLSLNVSSLQFHQSDIIEKVKKFFSNIELNKHVTFELTESVMMKNPSLNLEKLNALVEQNITLSIDDFGTGYSSLSYLHRFPVDIVKIDRSFISNLENDGQVIVKAIIAMAHGMGINVVAEGIENQWQYDFLKAEGCDIGQGYFISKPLLTEKIQQLLQNHWVST